MKPAQFQYHRPTSAAEAVDLAAELEEAEFMAGNQSLGIVMSNRLATPANIVDLSRLDELEFVEVEDDAVHVGVPEVVEGGRRRRSGGDLEVVGLPAQVVRREVSECVVVVDEQHPHRGIVNHLS